jgi:large subunit ribosomal protein L31|tara:strand:+ start:834 stop:1058 length:225 start_codon:yes stop_codon:yes gene_type:complete
MKNSIHPELFSVKVECSGCNSKYNILTTLDQKDLNIEVCSNCHSAYTGKRKILSAGAIDKFKQKFSSDFLGGDN